MIRGETRRLRQPNSNHSRYATSGIAGRIHRTPRTRVRRATSQQRRASYSLPSTVFCWHATRCQNATIKLVSDVIEGMRDFARERATRTNNVVSLGPLKSKAFDTGLSDKSVWLTVQPHSSLIPLPLLTRPPSPLIDESHPTQR